MPAHTEYSKLIAKRDNFLEEVTNYCLLGCSDAELGGFFGLSEGLVQHYIEIIPEFATAVANGRDLADARVAVAMHKAATGYDYDAYRVVVKDGHAEVVAVKEHVPPNPQAGKYWLNNRKRKHWKERQPPIFGNPEDGKEIQEITITFVAPQPPLALAPRDDDIESTAKLVVNDGSSIT
jgi:hypothetical protein